MWLLTLAATAISQGLITILVEAAVPRWCQVSRYSPEGSDRRVLFDSDGIMLDLAVSEQKQKQALRRR